MHHDRLVAHRDGLRRRREQLRGLGERLGVRDAVAVLAAERQVDPGLAREHPREPDVRTVGREREGRREVRATAAPPLWGLATAGEAGVARVLDLLADELELAMALSGSASIPAVTPRSPPPDRAAAIFFLATAPTDGV